MTKDQLRQIHNTIQSQIEYKQYCWEQSEIFVSNINDPMFKEYQRQYYEAQSKLEGMLYMYAILTNTNKYDLEQAIILKEEWRQQS